ncbi:MAG: translation initiation factor IF-2 [Candidatus Portnoybacteria bacterium]|nr:translation initiation factor IF-2 [Candidatus Portnoybacteria bacterium]
MAEKSENNLNNKSRPPVVVILGHVDHGKTSILDYIRKTKVAEKESGGITQHIGAYQVEHQGKKITFIDTPGHEAFSAMRSRGAKIADIAVLVVALDEGLKPQTKEAIGHITHLNLPFVVALNKADKPGIIPDKVKKQLSESGVLVESMGGKIPSVFTSAKTGIGIDELLEIILLLSEMEDLKGDFSSSASGVVIESLLDKQRGPTATLLVKDGLLSSGDIVVSESTFGAIKAMEDFRGERIKEARPSTPVRVIGFEAVPPVGEEWQVAENLEAARSKATKKGEQEKRKRDFAQILEIGPEQKVFNLILKADVFGSLEAISEALRTIPQEEVILRIVSSEVGDIGESDIKLAGSAKAKVFGFRVKTNSSVTGLAERSGIKIFNSDIIYELIQAIREEAALLLSPEVVRRELGQVKVLATFKQTGQKQIIGGRVIKGKMERGAMAEISREGEILGKGRIPQLQVNKDDVDSCPKDRECGMLFEGEARIEKGDILTIFREEKKRREL